MKILFIHPNIPGQYKHLVKHFASNPKNQVVFATNPKKIDLPGVQKIEYESQRPPTQGTHRYIIGLERALGCGQAMWKVCEGLKKSNFVPDIICAHPGWGDALFVKDSFPNVPLLSFFEFYYHAFGADVYFDPNEPIDPDDVARIRTKNCTNLLNLEASDWGVSPTYWQLIQHPKEFQYKISMIHDGIDTDIVKPHTFDKINLPNGTKLTPKDEIITYVSRNFEPYRGFPTFMHFLEIINRERPNAHVLIIGNDGVSYGRQRNDGKTFRQEYMDKITLTDPSRVHWLGPLPYEQYLGVLRASQAHIYLTVPFVLSWSMLEAMSAGCAVIGSDTPPVTEVIQDGQNGLICDFYSPEQLAKRVNEVLDHPDRMQDMRKAARQTVLDRYALNTLIGRHVQLIEDLVAGKTPQRYVEEVHPDFANNIDQQIKDRLTRDHERVTNFNLQAADAK